MSRSAIAPVAGLPAHLHAVCLASASQRGGARGGVQDAHEVRAILAAVRLSDPLATEMLAKAVCPMVIGTTLQHRRPQAPDLFLFRCGTTH